MKRFGFAIRTGGDPEIAAALESGIDRATRRAVDAQRSDAVRRVDMMRHTPEELAEMIEEARVVYGGTSYTPKWAERLLVVYAMICYGVNWLYQQQDRVLRRST